MGLEEEVENEILATLSSLSNRNSRKYGLFVAGLRGFKYLPSVVLSQGGVRGRFLEAYYTYMRKIDDVADGDAPLPAGYRSASSFIAAKLEFSQGLASPKDIFDKLLLHSYALAEQFGQRFHQETQDILGSMLFDANRRGKNVLFQEADLNDHFYRMDIEGTIRAALKIYGEDPKKDQLLVPLGIATRIHYNLRDYGEDIESGFINVSSEDCLRLGIRRKDIPNQSSTSVQMWKKDQAIKGLELLREHHHVTKEKFSFLARLTFPLVYSNPAQRYFEKVLNASN